MLRDYSDSLSSHLLQAFPPDHSYARVEFSHEPMPGLVSHFLAQTLQSRLDIEIERHRSVRSDWFAYDHPDVQHAHLTFAAMLGQHAHIPRNEWPRLLKEAVHTVLAFLVRPVPTLIDFLFDEEDIIPIHDVYRGLGFFGAYPYLREAATSFLHQKDLTEVDRDRFTAVLRRSDREITRDCDVSDWLSLLSPLFGMLNMDPANAGQGVPVEVLAAFFEEKEAGSILLHLRDAEEEPNARISEQDLRRIIETPPRPIPPPPPLEQEAEIVVPEAAEATVPEAPQPEPAPAPEPAATLPAPPQPKPVAEAPVQSRRPDQPAYRVKPEHIGASFPAPPAAPLPERTVQPESTAPPGPVQPRPAAPAQPPSRGVPLWQQFQESKKPPEAKPGAPPESERPAPRVQLPPRSASLAPPRPPGRDQRGDARGVPLWMQFRTSKPQPQQALPPELPPLERAVLGDVGRGERDLFVKHLFGGSVAEYERALRQLQAAPSWDRAKQIIATEVFVRHRVDIYSDAAMAFTNAVEERFSG